MVASTVLAYLPTLQRTISGINSVQDGNAPISIMGNFPRFVNLLGDTEFDYGINVEKNIYIVHMICVQSSAYSIDLYQNAIDLISAVKAKFHANMTLGGRCQSAHIMMVSEVHILEEYWPQSTYTGIVFDLKIRENNPTNFQAG